MYNGLNRLTKGVLLYMKRITLYTKSGEKLFAGNPTDLPLDEAEIDKEAQKRFGERVCPQRYAVIRQIILVGIFESNSNEIIIPDKYKGYLKHKNAYKIAVYNA